MKHYNAILKNQVRELDQEIAHVEMTFRQTYGVDPFAPVSPDTLLSNIAIDLKALQVNINTLEQDLAAFVDITQVKLWLRGQFKTPIQRT
ncbi:MAG: hypothetical protein V3Q69_04195 [Burkholderia sp.]